MIIRRTLNHEQRRGAAAVEAAILLPLIALLFLGSCEIGWYVSCAQIVGEAARQGARTAVFLENSNAEVLDAVHESLATSMGVLPSNIVVRISRLNEWGQEMYEVQSLDDNERGEPVRVTVTVTDGVLGLPTNFLNRRGQVSGFAVMQRLK